MQPNSESKTIVSAIVEKTENDTRYIYLQTRWKPKSSPTYSGLFEIPAGGVDGYEDVIVALKREVKEETGFDILRIIDDLNESRYKNKSGDESSTFQPFICQQMLSSNKGLPWIGFVFRCEVSGKLNVNREEAKDPQWVTIEQLKILLKSPELFFPLQYPVLTYYVKVVSV